MNQSKEEHQVGFVGPGSVTSMRMLHRWEMARQHGEIVSNTESLGYTVNLQLLQCGWKASPSLCGTSRMDSYGTFLERGVFTASQTHYFPQHGLVDTPDRVGDSSSQSCQLQSFRQDHSLQGTQPHAGKGKWSLD